MHWLLHLLVDAVLVFGLVASYCAYQEHRRKQSEYARVQLYEDADKPFCGGTPEVGGWTDPDDRDDVELTSVAVGPSYQTPPGANPARGGGDGGGGGGGGGGAASSKKGKGGKKSGNKTKRARADADLQEALSPYDVQALISKELEDI